MNTLKPGGNIILIGMPGSGKSTVGVILAKLASLNFLDSDVLIQTQQQRSLQDIVDNDGHMVLRQIEEDVLVSIDVTNHVIATGGSAPYSEKAMAHLQQNGLIIFLDVNIETLKKRITNYETRGLAKRKDQSFADLFQERLSLYRRYGQITIECSDLTQEEVCWEILTKVKCNLQP